MEWGPFVSLVGGLVRVRVEECGTHHHGLYICLVAGVIKRPWGSESQGIFHLFKCGKKKMYYPFYLHSDEMIVMPMCRQGLCRFLSCEFIENMVIICFLRNKVIMMFHDRL